ncbi:hypothetical protein FVEN_g930 [Fusarium venenatum]|uniref:uncharacterized protein n=1 Tax=Fusarium venenatum TaxID=56646 RepID=UPI001D86188A|nr:hypothetical protein FVEN_g930 [Fusarium venenatum]KAH6967247.1 hypothetical protein EDB82DRAFT_542247 [Fusarium venenatum]
MGYAVDIYIYGLGLILMYQGIVALIDPKGQFRLRGIKDMRSSEEMASFAPIYMLGVRDISMGIFMVAHHYVDNLTAVLTLLAIMSFFKFGDAVVVISVGDDRIRTKAIENMAMGSTVTTNYETVDITASLNTTLSDSFAIETSLAESTATTNTTVAIDTSSETSTVTGSQMHTITTSDAVFTTTAKTSTAAPVPSCVNNLKNITPGFAVAASRELL